MSKTPIYKWSEMTDQQLQQDTVRPALKALTYEELVSLEIRIICSNIGKRKKSPLLTLIKEAEKSITALIDVAVDVARADDSPLPIAIRKWSDARIKSGIDLTSRRLNEGDKSALRAFDLFNAEGIERGFGRDPEDFQVG